LKKDRKRETGGRKPEYGRKNKDLPFSCLLPPPAVASQLLEASNLARAHDLQSTTAA